ncbi:hypothetical protein M413DRAFT_78414 [Hebeloma cylindrosporum]|uniref:Uncharacterized protein n=1 Tax=Hebeloma cylindrosporum TaxID=76867 RepID=A0A0C3BHY8_HEBCY|nr:hypothetical protein M413DRAFT_78414 [Hebeloma cylindrosporum h7]
MNTSQVNATFFPGQAYQIMVSTHVIAGALAIMCWDILHNLNNDYRLLFKYRSAYRLELFISDRLGTLGYAVAIAITQTAPIGRCEELHLAMSCLYSICISATTLLFLFRVWAIWNRNKYVVWFFNFMWLGVVGAQIAAQEAVFTTNDGSSSYCTSKKAKPFVVVCVIIPVVNDTLVLLAVTIGFVMNTHLEPTLKHGMRTVIYGEYLPAFSKAMLRGNQMYYLVAVGCNLLTLVMFYINSLPEVYRSMLAVPNAIVMNIMACRVYRNTKFGNQWMEPAINITPIAFQEPIANSSATRALDLLSETGNTNAGRSGFVKGGNPGNVDVVDISQRISEMREDNNRGDCAV